MAMRVQSLVVVATFGFVAACGGDPPPGKTYYQRTIEPILMQSCAGNTSGCHRTNVGDRFQFAAGNFDVTSFGNVQKRRDLLKPFGAYQVPLLLVKSVAAGQLQLAYGDSFKDLNVLHAGGPILQVGSDAYLTLLTWMENGATANGLRPPSPARPGDGACSPAVPTGFVAAPYLANPNFAEFKNQVMPILGNCNSGSCHGAPQADLYLACGNDDTQLAFNMSQAWSFVDNPVDESQILRVPLARNAGGGPHTGGDQLPSRDSDTYKAIRTWAEKVGRIDFGIDPGRAFFADRVQPLLLVRGCAFEACHSPDATNDFKLRSGSQGFFSAISLERNYQLLKTEFMAMEVPDARRGRAISKSILEVDGGIGHRGGPILGGARPADCPGAFDPLTASPFCVMQEWVRIERQAMIAAGQADDYAGGTTLPLVYVDRSASHVAGALEFDTYQGGSDLRVASLNVDSVGAVGAVGGSTSLLAGCGVSTAAADVRAPDIRHDGTTVVFAMRTGANDPLGVWTVNSNGSNCQRITPAEPDRNGIKLHNFDPAWSPDGEWLVFASTRGDPAVGPTRSRKRFLPQSDIWRMHRDGSGMEQVTFLTGSELSPQMMREGRITMTTEKVSGDLYQLAGRRINWDRSDYHPLLAQRSQSKYADPVDPTITKPSVGYAQATDIREDLNNNFLAIFSDVGAKGGAGTLAIFNRSVGPFEAGRRANEPGFLESVRIVDPDASGRIGSATAHAYRNPSGLPDGRILVSYANVGADLATVTSLDWDVVAIDPRTGARTTLVGGAGAQVDAVVGIKHPAHALFENRRQLVFGGRIDVAATGAGRAIVHMPDAPMVFTLLTGNLRRGRPIDLFRKATQLAIYSEAAASATTTSGNTTSGIFEQRALLGRAPLRDDGSVRINIPGGKPVVFELQDGSGNVVANLGEEHQLAPGEVISLGIGEDLFDAVCGGCHGSVSGSELDVAVTPDALTGASQSLSASESPTMIGN
jgi:WD40-like Beta Propeller Repeat